jgi:hypothetical protein
VKGGEVPPDEELTLVAELDSCIDKRENAVRIWRQGR